MQPLPRSFKVALIALLILAAGFWPSPVSIAGHATSDISNGSFEDGAYAPGASPTGWSRDVLDPASAHLAWDKTRAHAGSKSVQISASVATDARWLQTVPVQPYTAYRMSGWIKTKNVAHTAQSVDAGANLSLLGTWTHSTGVFGTQDWTFISFEFNSEAQTQVTIAARLGYWSGITTGTAWFDDLRLELGKSNILPNGGVENGVYVVNGPPTGWTPEARNTKRAVFTWDDAQSYAGGRSMKLQLTNPDTASWQQTVSVQPNTDYQLSGWIKTRDITPARQPRDAGAHLAVEELGAFSEGVFDTHGWTYVQTTFNSRNHSTLAIAARLGRQNRLTKGTAWFDELRLAPLGQVQHPRWQILVLIYRTTDFAYTDSAGAAHHVVAKMTRAEQDRAANAARRFFGADVPVLTSGNMYPSLTIRYPKHALTKLDPYFDRWWPSPGNTTSDRSAAFDSVAVIWDPSGIDQATGQEVFLAGAGGLTPGLGTGQTYTAINIDMTSYTQRNVFKHEWGHSITSYYDAAGTAPKPAVNNHINDTDTRYVHCSTGEAYILQDEDDGNLIPNSIYNNVSGFTHDYYSGMTAAGRARSNLARPHCHSAPRPTSTTSTATSPPSHGTARTMTYSAIPITSGTTDRSAQAGWVRRSSQRPAM